MTYRKYIVRRPWRERKESTMDEYENDLFYSNSTDTNHYSGEYSAGSSTVTFQLKKEIMKQINKLHRVPIPDDLVQLRELFRMFFNELKQEPAYWYSSKLYRMIKDYKTNLFKAATDDVIDVAIRAITSYLENDSDYTIKEHAHSWLYGYSISFSGISEFDEPEVSEWDDSRSGWIHKTRWPSLPNEYSVVRSDVEREMRKYNLDPDSRWVKFSVDTKMLEYHKRNSGSGFWKYRHIEGRVKYSGRAYIDFERYFREKGDDIFNACINAIEYAVYLTLGDMLRYTTLPIQQSSISSVYSRKINFLKKTLEYL